MVCLASSHLKRAVIARETYHHGDLEAQALQRADAWIQEHGPDQLSMRALARELGVNHAALYRHFEDKSALLIAIAAHGFHDLCDRLDEHLKRAPRDLGRMFVEVYVRFALESPHRYRTMFSVPHGTFDQHPGLWPAVKRLVDVSLEIYAPLFVPSSEVVLRDRIVAVWAQTHGLIELYLGGALRAGSSAQAEAYVVGRVLDVQSAWLRE